MDSICIECQHCCWPSAATGSPSMIEASASCDHPDVSTYRSPVTGREGKLSCRHVRRDGSLCGPQGQWFKQRRGESGA